MAGNGGGVGTQTQQVNPALQPYGNALFNNPNAQGGMAQQRPSQSQMVNPHTGQAGQQWDPMAAAKASRGYVAAPQQATNSYNFAPGQAQQLGADIRTLQANPGMQPQFGPQAMQGGMAPQPGYQQALSGALGGAMSGLSPQMMGGSPYSGMGFTGQPWAGQQSAAMPWMVPQINSMPYQNPFLMAMLANYGGMR